MAVMTCEQADERYATVRMFGDSEGGLREHAEQCERPEWTHALPTEFWPLVQGARGRRTNLRQWQTTIRGGKR